MANGNIFPAFQSWTKLWILCFPTSIHDYPKISFKILIISLCLASFVPNFIYARFIVQDPPPVCVTEYYAFSICTILNSIFLAAVVGHYNLESRYKLYQNLTKINKIHRRIKKEFKLHLSFATEQKLIKYGSAIISFLTALAFLYMLFLEMPVEIARGVDYNLVAFLGAMLSNMMGCLWLILSILVKWVLVTILSKQNRSLRNEEKETQVFREIFFQHYLATDSFNHIYGFIVLFALFFGLGQSVIIIYSILKPTRSCLMKNYSFALLVCVGLILTIRLCDEKVSINVSMN